MWFGRDAFPPDESWEECGRLSTYFTQEGHTRARMAPDPAFFLLLPILLLYPPHKLRSRDTIRYKQRGRGRGYFGGGGGPGGRRFEREEVCRLIGSWELMEAMGKDPKR
eukprot:408082-Amorphochlora_amoeboformis.AAC.1